jgi:alkylation response protein AidB-like acyl-CoA dehydrogenase
MDFDVSEEQGLFKDAIDKLVLKEYGFEQRRAYARAPEGWSRTVWAQLADQGFLALPFAEAHGGLGYGPVEMMLVMEALGRGLTLEPYLSTVVLAGSALRAVASETQLQQLVPQIVAGDLVLALAYAEKQSRYRLDDVATTAVAVDGGYRLDGTKIAVVHGDSAQRYLVSARTAGARADAEGITLFLVDAEASGLRRRGYRIQDGLRAADLILDGVIVSAENLVGKLGQGHAALVAAVEAGIAAQAAEAVGCMTAALDATVRSQFGAPIGRFQALQHRAAEMLVEVEQARSMAMLAALVMAEDDAQERQRTLAAVKVQIGKSGRIVGQLAVQLHGGIGVTEECAVGHYFRRLTVIETQFGDGDHHLRRIVAAGGLMSMDN